MQDTFSGLARHFPVGVSLRSLRGSWGSLGRPQKHTHTHKACHAELRKIHLEQVGKSESESLSRVQLSVTPWAIQLMESSRPEYWSGEPLPSPGVFPTQGSNPGLPLPDPGLEPGSPTLQADSLPTELSRVDRAKGKRKS